MTIFDQMRHLTRHVRVQNALIPDPTFVLMMTPEQGVVNSCKKIARGLFDNTIQFQLQQDARQFAGCHGQFAAQIVYMDRIGLQGAAHDGFFSRESGRLLLYGRVVIDRPRAFEERAGDFLKNILRVFDQLGTLLDQRMGADALERLDAARHGKDLSVLFGGQTGRDQRTTFF